LRPSTLESSAATPADSKDLAGARFQTHLHKITPSTASRNATPGGPHSKVNTVYSRVLLLAVAFTVVAGCDTNVRDVYGSDAVLSMDGERIATIRTRYEHYNNLVTRGTGPGSRDHEFSVYTWETPDVRVVGATTLPSFPAGRGDTFAYRGRLSEAQYVHHGARRFVVGQYTNADQETRAAILRIDAAGAPVGGWRPFGAGTPEDINTTEDGRFIAVTNRIEAAAEQVSFEVVIYESDTLAAVHTEQLPGQFRGNHYGFFQSIWHKAPRGSDSEAIGTELTTRRAMETNMPHPASPLWPDLHATLMDAVIRSRTLADSEWSFLAIMEHWGNPQGVPAQLFTMRQAGDVTRTAVALESTYRFDSYRNGGVYRARQNGLGYDHYVVTGSGGDLVVVYAEVPEGNAFMNSVGWSTQTMTFDYLVRFGADYPYRAAFEVDRIDRDNHSIWGHIAQPVDNREEIFPLDAANFAAVRLDWTRDADGLLRTCFVTAPNARRVNAAEIDAADLEFGCDGGPWDALSLQIGQDCDGTWNGHRTDTCEVDCAGVWGGDARLDACGVCDADAANDNTTCEQDCADVYGGTAIVEGDECVSPAGMVLIPAGTFLAGDREDERRATLPAYYMDLYEVSAGEYHQCVRVGACTYNGPTGNPDDHLGEWTEGRRNYQNGRDDHPMNFVTWSQAADYCGFVGKRLPTTMEWEKAARGVDGRTYPWGEAEPSCALAVMYSHRDEGDGAGCGVGHTSPVGQKPAGRSPYGLYDMAGNVAEWTTFPHWDDDMSQYPMGGGFDGGGQSEFFAPNARLSQAYRIEADHGFRCAR